MDGGLGGLPAEEDILQDLSLTAMFNNEEGARETLAASPRAEPQAAPISPSGMHRLPSNLLDSFDIGLPQAPAAPSQDQGDMSNLLQLLQRQRVSAEPHKAPVPVSAQDLEAQMLARAAQQQQAQPPMPPMQPQLLQHLQPPMQQQAQQQPTLPQHMSVQQQLAAAHMQQPSHQQQPLRPIGPPGMGMMGQPHLQPPPGWGPPGMRPPFAHAAMGRPPMGHVPGMMQGMMPQHPQLMPGMQNPAHVLAMMRPGKCAPPPSPIPYFLHRALQA